jgi:hypothetical protein
MGQRLIGLEARTERLLIGLAVNVYDMPASRRFEMGDVNGEGTAVVDALRLALEPVRDIRTGPWRLQYMPVMATENKRGRRRVLTRMLDGLVTAFFISAQMILPATLDPRPGNHMWSIYGLARPQLVARSGDQRCNSAGAFQRQSISFFQPLTPWRTSKRGKGGGAERSGAGVAVPIVAYVAEVEPAVIGRLVFIRLNSLCPSTLLAPYFKSRFGARCRSSI